MRFASSIQKTGCVLGIALVSLGVSSGCSKKADSAMQRGPGGPVPVNATEAVKKDMPLDLRAIGNVESIENVGIKAQVGGLLIGVHFKEGQDIKKGDLLFTIQPKLYETQLAQAQANLARDRVSAAKARRDAQRQEELGVKGATSKEQLDQAVAQADAADATVKADEALVEIAQVRVGYTTIESPIDGRAGALKVQAGNVIKENADDPMVTIRQIAPIYVSFSVPEQHLTEIRAASARVPMTVIALDPRTKQPLAEGKLTFIDNTVDTTTGTVVLKATFKNDDRVLWPGQFVDVNLRLRTDSGVTVVPSSAVTVGQRGQQIFVINKENKAELRAVVVQRTIGQESIIQKGVVAGETVVTNGQVRLTHGAPVVVKADLGTSVAPSGNGANTVAEDTGKKNETGG